LLLAVVLVLAVAVSEPGHAVSSDEGAALGQAQLLRESGGWYYDYPLGWMVDASSARPYIRADVGSNGVAPYAKHPGYPVLLRAMGSGTSGAIAASVAGTVLAATAAALLARRFSREAKLPILALWSTGLATPLLFDSGLMLAHTLAAAAFGFSVLGALAALGQGRGSGLALVGSMASASFACFVRTESVLVVMTLAVVVAAGLRTRRSVVLGGAIALAGVLTVVVDRLAAGAIVGTAEVTPPNTLTYGLPGRWNGFYTTWLSSTYGIRTFTGTLIWSALAAVACAAVLLRRGSIRPGIYAAVTLAGSFAYVAWAFARPAGLVPGLLVTIPFLFGLAWFIDGRAMNREWQLVVWVVGLGSLAILATQYSIGGGVEWGGRYFAVLLAPTTAVVLSGAWSSFGRAVPAGTTRSAVVASAAIATLAVVAVGFIAMRDAHGKAAELSSAIEHASAHRWREPASQREVVVTTNRLLPQLLVTDVDRYAWVAADQDDLLGFLEQLTARGMESFVLVAPLTSDLADDLEADAWDIHLQRTISMYDVAVIERRVHQ